MRTPDDAIGLGTLRAAAARNPRFSIEVVATARDGWLTADRLVGSAPFPVGEAELWLCGRPRLEDAILRGLGTLGQTPRRLRFEEFKFA